MGEEPTIRVGSRKSQLALIQTHYVIDLLKKFNPQKKFEIVTMSTLGDKVLDIPLPKIGEKSLFTQELEAALAVGTVDFVVHSLKDLPTALPNGMAIGAVLTREDPRDALVLHPHYQNYTLESLPKDSVIGTSSLRRTAQLAKKYPHLKVESIRGNLNTRLRKLDELGIFQGIVLAVAGLYRMGWNHRISKILDDNELLYAVGQGALAVECRENDENTILLLKSIYDSQTALQVITERSFLRTLEGGCSAPVAVTTKVTPYENKYKICLTGAVWSLDGMEEIMKSDEAVIEIKERRRCAVCPYGQEVHKNCSSSEANSLDTDIECLSRCSSKRSIELDEKSSKKQKPNNDSVDILKSDPHQHCPVKLPIGVDFMGQCPYFESDINLVNINKRCPVYGKLESINGDFSKCPFLKEGVLQTVISESKKDAEQPGTSYQINSKLYTGLVPHDDITELSLNEAQSLGIRLAQTLIKHGAIKIMTKAQECIRNN